MLLHFKRNHLLLLLWMLLFGYTSGLIGAKYGFRYLFLAPEYIGEVNYWSHLILGFAVGGFIMAFNIYCYALYGAKFPFIATLARPFIKFCLNNLILPTTFVLTHTLQIIDHQVTKEFYPLEKVLVHCLGYVVGLLIFFALSYLYFFRFNKNLYKLTGIVEKKLKKQPYPKGINNVLHKKEKWYYRFSRKKDWVVKSYLSSPTSIKLARDGSHYDRKLLRKVFAQNHISASIFEAFLIISFFMLGILRETEAFVIPAAASLLLLFSVLIMVFSALYSWFERWTISLLLVMFFGLNFLTEEFETIRFKNFAYGINYNGNKVNYSSENFHQVFSNDSIIQSSKLHHLNILENWKSKINKPKPKIVFITASGGGQRAALWTYYALAIADSITQGHLLNHTHLITGASGGMIGAAYLREISKNRLNPLTSKYVQNISKDMLNPLTFSLVTTDFLIRYQKFKVGNYYYTKDRGYVFEKQLNKNTEGIFSDKTISDYAKAEFSAAIPQMILTPTVINDSRRLLIGSQPLSFLCSPTNYETSKQPLYEDLDFGTLFEKQDAKKLMFSSALRMNATFPYITPVVTLPTTPSIAVMDAGVRDNFGVKTCVNYIQECSRWINKNTSGVVIIQLRDTEKRAEIDQTLGSLAERLITPVGTFQRNFTKVQDYQSEYSIKELGQRLNVNLDVVSLCLSDRTDNKIALSWHLTELEKKEVTNSINLPENQNALVELQRLLLDQNDPYITSLSNH